MFVVATLVGSFDKLHDGDDAILRGLRHIAHRETANDVFGFVVVVVIQLNQLFDDTINEALNSRGHVGQCGTTRRWRRL